LLAALTANAAFSSETVLFLLAIRLGETKNALKSPFIGVFPMPSTGNTAVFGFFLLALSVLGPPARAATYDGNWSVLIITEKGDCDRAYRYPLAVADGKVRYTGDAGANVSGTVSAAGAVKVSIRLGDKGANGSGRLSGNSGSGSWRGAGGGASCAGRWEAEKR
jgi:hypothetical protein